MAWSIILLLAVLGINKGVTQEPACLTENTCDCCQGNPYDGTRDLSDICDNKKGDAWICIYGCLDGYFGRKCWNICPSSCINCHREYNTQNVCYQCVDGYYNGVGVTDCSTPCPVNCAENKCDQMSGYCMTCIKGFYGEMCSLVCSSNCYECNKNDGVCISCINGYYGQTCDMKCPENCVNKICDQENGMCLRCKNGYYGSSCNMTCSSNCKDGLCGQDTGYCRLGCVTSAEGNCEQLSTSPETTVTSEMLDRQTIVMIGGLVGGFVLIMIIVNVELFILKRISNCKSTGKTYMEPSRPKEDNDPESMYANPDVVTDGDL